MMTVSPLKMSLFGQLWWCGSMMKSTTKSCSGHLDTYIDTSAVHMYTAVGIHMDAEQLTWPRVHDDYVGSIRNQKKNGPCFYRGVVQPYPQKHPVDFTVQQHHLYSAKRVWDNQEGFCWDYHQTGVRFHHLAGGQSG